MRKYIIGFAPVGILALAGFGVDLLPNIESYLPSIIIFIIAGLWLIATLIYLMLPKLRLGSAIFHLRFYRNYYEEEIGIIEPTKEQLKRILPNEPKGRIIHIPTHHKEKRRIRKKRFEL